MFQRICSSVTVSCTWILVLIPKHTLQETNISHFKGTFEDDFPIPQVGYVNSLEGICFRIYHQKVWFGVCQNPGSQRSNNPFKLCEGTRLEPSQDPLGPPVFRQGPEVWYEIFRRKNLFGEDEPILMSIFFKGVGSTTNQWSFLVPNWQYISGM